MTSLISHPSFDSLDAYAMSVFWGNVLGFSQDPDNPERARRRGMHDLLRRRCTAAAVHRGTGGKQIKNRLHLDLRPAEGTRDEELARLLSLGARTLEDRRRPDGSGWVVLADPEGTSSASCAATPNAPTREG